MVYTEKLHLPQGTGTPEVEFPIPFVILQGALPGPTESSGDFVKVNVSLENVFYLHSIAHRSLRFLGLLKETSLDTPYILHLFHSYSESQTEQVNFGSNNC